MTSATRCCIEEGLPDTRERFITWRRSSGVGSATRPSEKRATKSNMREVLTVTKEWPGGLSESESESESKRAVDVCSWIPAVVGVPC